MVATAMHRISKQLDFCYGHRLLNYEGPCRHLHGHNGRVEITLAAENLDARGMLVDFKDLQEAMQGWLDQNLDHRLLLQRSDPYVALLQAQNEPLFLMESNPTAENIARLIFEEAKRRGFPVVEVELWETPRASASYREAAL